MVTLEDVLAGWLAEHPDTLRDAYLSGDPAAWLSSWIYNRIDDVDAPADGFRDLCVDALAALSDCDVGEAYDRAEAKVLGFT